MTDYARFWFCLDEGYQSFLQFMAGWVALPDPVVYLDTYRTYWETYRAPLDTPYYDYFFLEWGLTQTDVEVLPGVVLPGVVWTIGRYLELNLWLLDLPDVADTHCRTKESFFSLPI